ncbi:MAG: GIY-YIG nuclease family protein [Gammaproteobacteria bacterium]|nr:GIY-YIG nuclease family protein [Gammaproteobacteria bacterium]
MSQKEYFVYILHCSNNSLYTGFTTDLVKRYKHHLKGTGGCKYTKSFKPHSLVQSWLIMGTKAQAMQAERYIKKLTRKEKDILIIAPERLSLYFPLERVTDEFLDFLNSPQLFTRKKT